MRLKAIQFLSVRVPSGQIVTMHSGNTRDLDADDARWLLDTYPQRVVALDAPDDQLVASAESELSADTSDADEVEATATEEKADEPRASKPRKAKKG